MGQLIDDLLAFSQAGRTDLALTPVDMTAVAKEAFARVVPDPGSPSRISFTMGVLPEASGDASLLLRVWVNLLSNAVKFSAVRERPEIRVEGEVEGGEAIYRVRDNGVGFDMKHVDQLFGVFHRLHGVSEFEGTGVGLALARRIVARHGGRAWAESEPGRGATFSFSLPARRQSEPHRSIAPTRQRPPPRRTRTTAPFGIGNLPPSARNRRISRSVGSPTPSTASVITARMNCSWLKTAPGPARPSAHRRNADARFHSIPKDSAPSPST